MRWIVEKDTFKELILSYLIPLFSGSNIKSETPSTKGEDIVAFDKGYSSILVKPKHESDYRLQMSRAQPFEKGDEQLVRFIIQELVEVSEINISDHYKSKLQYLSIEKAICQFLLKDYAETLLALLQLLSYWSERTYEGRRASFGYVLSVHDKKPEKEINFKQFLYEDFAALLTDGMDSWLVLNQDGCIIQHETDDTPKCLNTYSPLRFMKIAESCEENRIGVSLSNGEILIFKNKQLKFAKRRGAWRSFNHDSVIQQMAGGSSYSNLEVRKAIYQTALDVSFSRTGGCIAYLKKTIYQKKFDEHVDSKDKVSHSSNEKNIKATTLHEIIKGKKFHELDRKFRLELVGIDGATIIDYEGNIVAVGAIIKIEPGSTGGGRLAASETLSSFGVALKISEDGEIKCFKGNRKTKNCDELFVLG